jgi:tetratricopeptide (TPR) repeat protein
VLADIHGDLGQHGEAVAVAREALTIAKADSSQEQRDYHRRAINLLSRTLVDSGKSDEAIQVRREFVEDCRRLLPPEDLALASALAQLGELLLEQDKYAEAEPALRECAAIREIALGLDSPDYWYLANARSMFGGALAGQAAALIESDAPAAISKFTKAEPLLVESADWLTRNADRIPQESRAKRLRKSLERIVSLYERWDAVAPETGKADRAAEWRAELEKPSGQ